MVAVVGLADGSVRVVPGVGDQTSAAVGLGLGLARPEQAVIDRDRAAVRAVVFERPGDDDRRLVLGDLVLERVGSLVRSLLRRGTDLSGPAEFVVRRHDLAPVGVGHLQHTAPGRVQLGRHLVTECVGRGDGERRAVGRTEGDGRRVAHGVVRLDGAAERVVFGAAGCRPASTRRVDTVDLEGEALGGCRPEGIHRVVGRTGFTEDGSGGNGGLTAVTGGLHDLGRQADEVARRVVDVGGLAAGLLECRPAGALVLLDAGVGTQKEAIRRGLVLVRVDDPLHPGGAATDVLNLVSSLYAQSVGFERSGVGPSTRGRRLAPPRLDQLAGLDASANLRVRDGLRCLPLELGLVLAEILRAGGVLDHDLRRGSGQSPEVAGGGLGLLRRSGLSQVLRNPLGGDDLGVAAPLAVGAQLGLGELVPLLGPSRTPVVLVGGGDIGLPGDPVDLGHRLDNVLVEPFDRRLGRRQIRVRGPAHGEAPRVVAHFLERGGAAHRTRSGVVDVNLAAGLRTDRLHAEPVEVRGCLTGRLGDPVGHVDLVREEGDRRQRSLVRLAVRVEAGAGYGLQPQRRMRVRTVVRQGLAQRPLVDLGKLGRAFRALPVSGDGFQALA